MLKELEIAWMPAAIKAASQTACLLASFDVQELSVAHEPLVCLAPLALQEMAVTRGLFGCLVSLPC